MHMSYPDPRYSGDTGELSATYRPDASEPELTYPSSGNFAHYLATGASTHGLFGLYRWHMQPRSGGPNPHFHRTITESFYVLTGTVRIFDGRNWIATGPGDWVHVPEGGVHGFRNESDEPASMLLHFAPGAPREGYFENIPTLAQRSNEERDAFFVEHDTYWL